MTRLMITGGTGSLGQALTAHWLLKPELERLVIYSRDEQKQAAMRERFADDRLRFFIGDVRDRDRLTMAMRSCAIVIHAAAMKIVRACEYNPFECIRTNVMGSENVIHAAIQNGVENVLLVSSDKAVNPINLYGASKLGAEKLFLAANGWLGRRSPAFHAIRYGNVAGSRGSVLDRWGNGDSAVITDAGATRFWLTLRQACGWIDRALNEDAGTVLVPKLPSCTMLTVAQAILGRHPRAVGLQRGEKMHELLYSEDEADAVRDHGGHYVIHGHPSNGAAVERRAYSSLQQPMLTMDGFRRLVA